MEANNKLKQIQKNFNLKKYNEVILQCRKLIKKNPNNFILNHICGLAYFSINYFEKSIEYLKKANEIKPNDMICKNNLGNSYKSYGNLAEADKIYNEILKKIPNEPTVIVNLAIIKKNILDFKSSIKLGEKAIKYSKSEQQKKNTLLGIANNHIILGEFRKAKEVYNNLIKDNPNNIRAYIGMSKLIDYEKNKTHLKFLISLLNHKNLLQLEQAELCFAIGKGYESIKNYDESYKYLFKANEIQDKINNYQISKHKILFKEIKKIFQKEKFETVHGDFSSKKIIFICGMPRSGSTLVHQILASHNEVVGAGELVYMEQSIKKLFFEGEKIIPQKIKNLINSKENILNKEYFKLLEFHNYTSSIIIDKTPDNFIWIGLILYFFPNCKIIHCYRNAEDNLVSLFKNYFPSNHMSWSSNLTNIVKFYNLYSDLMKFWNKKFSNKIYNLNYETLVSDSKNEIQKMLNYCDLGWDENCLQYYNNKNTPIATVSMTEARKPIYKKSVNLSKNYYNYLSEYFRQLDK